MFKKYRFSFFVIIVLGVLVDQLTKNFAMSKLEDGSHFYGGTRLGFELAYNSGSAFSLFGGSTLLLTILSISICSYLIYAYPKNQNRLMQLAFNLIIAGALGNVVDRFVRTPYNGKGHVVDFIVLWSWPTFNVADSLVTIGVVLAIVATLFFNTHSAKEASSN